jgi:hypothetical protein
MMNDELSLNVGKVYEDLYRDQGVDGKIHFG